VRLLLALTCAAVIGVGISLTAFARPHTRPIAHVNPGGGYSADVFAHGGFAYLSSWHGKDCPSQGVRVYDVRRPTRPRRVATFADLASDPLVRGTWTEKTIVKRVRARAFTGELAVTSFQHCKDAPGSFQGFGLYDVTRPQRPRKLALVRLDPRGSHEIWLQAVGRRAYVYTAIPFSESESAPNCDTPGRPGFRIFDVSNPVAPKQVGEWGAWKELGIRPGRCGARAGNFVHSVITNPGATRAFLSYWNLGTVILDIRNPARPGYLGRTRDTQGAAHSAALSRDGRLLLETHERPGGRVGIFNVSNPRRPVRLSTFAPPTRLLRAARRANVSFTDSVHDPKLVGTKAYFSWYSLGVIAVELANPRRPRFLAQYLPGNTRDPEKSFCPDAACSLTWGVYPLGRYLLASDIVGGLAVFRIR
jgi:hypothetical protein